MEKYNEKLNRLKDRFHVEIERGLKMKQEIENVITFLEENEQYGDDWSEEIKVLKKMLKYQVWRGLPRSLKDK